MAHGFTQTGRAWGSIDRNLATDHQLVLVDLPGHGRSSELAASLEDGAFLLTEVGGRGAYLGYSMGARFCLHAALACPDLVEQVVLISGTAGIDDDREREQRRRSDEQLADQLDPRPASDVAPETVETFVQRWLENPMFNGISPEATALPERLRNTGRGLASSLRLAGTGTQRPLWDLLGQLTMPVLIVTGQLDQKFTSLGERMVDAIGPSSSQAVIPDAGHAPHLQRPDRVAAVVRRFLEDHRGH
jgi:2-succinyl-6-hydroxy-2,4-cyclohexadiene-1-carboxylate synthase